jgi:hypothetical protein
MYKFLKFAIIRSNSENFGKQIMANGPSSVRPINTVRGGLLAQCRSAHGMDDGASPMAQRPARASASAGPSAHNFFPG